MTVLNRMELAAILPDAAHQIAEAVSLRPNQFSEAIGRPELRYCAVINYSGVVIPESLAFLRQALEELRQDEMVSELIVRVSSPGGLVMGVAEAAEIVRRFANEKPMTVLAENFLCSAAYWVFSGATQIIASPSCLVGSLGVVRVLVDDSEMWQSMGIKVHAVATAQQKRVGISGIEVSEQDLERVRAEIEETRVEFQRDLRLGGRMTAAQREAAFEDGGVWRGQQAKKRRLVNAVAIPEDVIAEKLAQIRHRQYLYLVDGEAAATKLEHLTAKAGGCEFYFEAPEGTAARVRKQYPELAQRADKFYRKLRASQAVYHQRLG